MSYVQTEAARGGNYATYGVVPLAGRGTHVMLLRHVISLKGDGRRITNAWKKATGKRTIDDAKTGECFEFEGTLYMRVFYKHGYANGYGRHSPFANAWVDVTDCACFLTTSGSVWVFRGDDLPD